MNFQNLKAIANGTRDAQHAAFGTHFAKNASVEDLSEKEKETLLALLPKITKKARQIAESERECS